MTLKNLFLCPTKEDFNLKIFFCLILIFKKRTIKLFKVKLKILSKLVKIFNI